MTGPHDRDGTPPTDWFDDAAVDAAIAARRAQHDAAHRASESATWTGLLADLAEAAADVQVRTSAGTAHSGRLVAVAEDHLVVRSATAVTVVARAEVVTVQQPPTDRRRSPVGGERPAPLDRTLDEVLAAWAEDRAPCRLVLRGDEVVDGLMVGVGVDLLAVVPERDGVASRGQVVHVPLDAVVAVTVR